VFNGSGGTFQLQAALPVNENFVITAGSVTTSSSNWNITASSNVSVANGSTFNLGGSSMSVAGNWTDNGTFLAVSPSSVTFSGAAASTQTLTGSTTFYNFVCNTGGLGFNFPSNSTQTVQGLLTMTGAGGSLITLRPSSASTYWYLNNLGTNNVSYVDTSYSNAGASTTITDGTGGIDSGNNVNWTFAAVAAKTTDWTGGTSTNWSTAGNWDNGVPGASDKAIILSTATNMPILTASVSVSTLTINATTATLTLNGFNLTVTSFTNAGSFVFLGTETVTSAPNAISGSTITYAATSGTTPILSTWTYRNLVFNGSGGTFTTPSGGLTVNENFTLSTGTVDTGGNVNGGIAVTGNVNLNAGTLKLTNTNGSIFYGNWTLVSGTTFNAGTSTVTFAGTGSNTITSGGQSFQNVTFAGGATWTLQDALSVNGTLSVTNGTFSTGSNKSVTVAGNFKLNQSGSLGIFNLNASTMSVAGNWTNTGTFNAASGSTVTFNGAASSTQYLTGSTTFYNFACTTAGLNLNFVVNSTQTVQGLLTLTGASGNLLVVQSSSEGTYWYLNNSGTNNVSYVDAEDSNAGAAGGNTITDTTGGANSGNTVNWTFPGAVAYTWTGTANTAWNNSSNWSNGGGGSFPHLGDQATIVSGPSNQPIATAHVNVSTLTVNSGATLTLNGFVLTVTSFTNAGSFVFLGTENVTSAPNSLSGSSVTYNATSGTTPIFSTWTYRNLVFNGSGGTFQLQAALPVNENFVITAGSVTTSSSNWNITASSNVSVASGSTFNLGGSSMSVAGNWTDNGTFLAVSPSSVTFTTASGSTSTLTGSTTFYNLKDVTAGGWLSFATASTQTVTNLLTLTGSSGNTIKLRSSSTNSPWFLEAENAGANNVSYVDTEDSNANAGGTIVDNPGGVDSMNNVNWVFGAANLSLSVSPSSYDFGALPVSSASVAASAIAVTNNGNVIEDFSLNASSTTDWFLATSTAAIAFDTFTVSGVFAPSMPTLSTYTVYDVILSTSQTASGNYFVLSGSTETGTSIAVNAIRHLWFRMDTPSSSSSGNQESSTVTITAAQSP